MVLYAPLDPPLVPLSEPLSSFPEAPHANPRPGSPADRKSTRLNSSHSQISYAVFCLKKKTTRQASAFPFTFLPSRRMPLPTATALTVRTSRHAITHPQLNVCITCAPRPVTPSIYTPR